MPFRETEEIKTEKSLDQSDDRDPALIRCASKTPTEKESKLSENVYSLHLNETRDPDSRAEEKSENSGTLDPEDPLNITVQDLNEISKPEEIIQELFHHFTTKYNKVVSIETLEFDCAVFSYNIGADISKIKFTRLLP